jgi:hypothetical protein
VVWKKKARTRTVGWHSVGSRTYQDADEEDGDGHMHYSGGVNLRLDIVRAAILVPGGRFSANDTVEA